MPALARAPDPTRFEIKLTPMQSRIFRDEARFRVVIAGRRSGKTFGAVSEMIFRALEKDGALIWYVAHVLDDAFDTAFEPVLELLPDGYVAEYKQQPMRIKLRNGSKIQFFSADKPKRGRGLDFVVLDEFAFYEEKVWTQEIRPALSDRLGDALFITTPTGHNWAYDLYLKDLEDAPGWSSYQFTTVEGGIVTPEEVEDARRDLDPRIFRQEYEASFETLAGRVYSNFSRKHHPHGNLHEDLEDTGGELLVGMDFNVNPMSAVVATRAADECHVLESIEIQTSNTEEMATELRSRYPDRKIIVCPDPTGRARKTSAPVGQTDFTILRRHGFKVRAPEKAPPVVDRINNVQSMLLAGDGDRRRLLVHPRAQKLIRALSGLTYKDGSSQPDKTQGLDHITDALGYLLWEEFNQLEQTQIKTQSFRIV